MSPLADRHALVTGGGSGVGAAIALALAGAGARVTIAGRRREALAHTAARHPAITAIVADVTDDDAVAALFRQAGRRHGPAQVVVANAGASTSQPFAKTSPADWQRMLDVNLTGCFLTFRHAVPAMLEAGHGRLIAVASTAAQKGYGYVAGYCAAKHGVLGLVRALAVEYARKGITANALCPGFTESPMLDASIANIVASTGRSEEQARSALASHNPQGRFVHPDEVAAAALWLCGPGSDAVTGQAISISGGETG